MALFKILNNFDSGNVISALSSHKAGFCYFDKNTNKFYIDTTDAATGLRQLNGTFYGECSTPAGTAIKVVNIDGFGLTVGVSVFVKFNFTNSAGSESLELNVSGTGSKPIKRYGTTNLASANAITAGMVCQFVYDGTNWIWVGHENVNTDTNVSQVLSASNAQYPVLLSYSTQGTNTSTVDNVAYRSNKIYANPSTGVVTAENFAGKINGHTVNSDVPSGAKFTDTTYNFGAGLSTSGSNVNLSLLSTTQTTNEANVTNHVYPVEIDKNGKLAVLVPWINSNTTYTNGDGLDLTDTVFSHYSPANADITTELDPEANNKNIIKTLSLDNFGHIVSSTYSDGKTFFYIEGSISDAAGVWTGTQNEITEYYNGLTVMYVPKVAGKSGSVTLNINGLGAIQCYTTNTDALTTHYKANTPILFTYYDGKWRRADYNANTTYTKMTAAEQAGGTATTARTISADVLRKAIVGQADTAGYAVTASNATLASSATYAVTAGNAVNAANAVTATAAVTASNAIKAHSAAYAITASAAITASNAVKAHSAAYAITASHAASATTAGAAVTASYAANAVNATNATKATQDASGNVITTTYATKAELNNLISANDALIFKGTLGATNGTTTAVPANSYQTGWTYRVVDAGTYAGQVCEIGDLLIAISDGPATGTAVTNTHWTVAQTNIDGVVTSPQTSSTSGSIAIFTGTNGKTITKVGSAGTSTKPIYIDSNGRPAAITSYEGMAGSATYAASAAQATHAASATFAVNATNAVEATHSASATFATNAGSATSAANATYAGSAGSAKTATTASQAVHAASATWALSAGSATSASQAVHAASANYAASANVANSANTAITAGNAVNAGTAVSAGTATTAGNAVSAGSALSAGSAAYALKAASATYAASSLTASNAVTAGQAIHAASATYASSASFANTATFAAVSEFSTIAQKANSANITATPNSVAYFSDAGGQDRAFFNSIPSADGVLYATTANGALNWGTLPIEQGGTGATTTTAARVNLKAAPVKQSVFYGLCNTPAATVDKEVMLIHGEGYVEEVGTMVVVNFVYGPAAASSSEPMTMKVGPDGTARNLLLYNNYIMNNNQDRNGWRPGAVVPFVLTGNGWTRFYWQNSTYNTESIYTDTAAGTAAKVGYCTLYAPVKGFQQVLIMYSNTAKSKLTLNVNSQGAKDIWIGGEISSATNYTLPRGLYLAYYDGTNYHFDLDGSFVVRSTPFPAVGIHDIESGRKGALIINYSKELGLFDGTKWLVYSDTAGNAYMNGRASCATYAANAGSSTHASSASYAANAGNATHAASAGYAASATYAVDAGSIKSKIFYGTCNTATATTAKAVTCPEFTAGDLTNGATVYVTFDYTNSGAVGSLTLNVNGTGAKPIKEFRNGSVSNIPGANYLATKQTYRFSYDGTNWVTVMDYDSNDVNRSTITYPRIIAGLGGIGRYTLFMETATPGIFASVTSTANSTGTSKVKNGSKFRLGKVFYSNRNSDITALDEADTTNSWMDQQVSLLDLKYSLNIANGDLTARQPLFLVGTLSDDGYFQLDDIWWTQTPEEVDNGKVYIYVGQVYPDSAPYRCTLDLDNPAIWYKDGGWKNVVPYAAKTETAISASSAGSAGYATTAAHAGNAGNANTATTAGQAVHAASAGYALSSNCAANATNAGNANTATTAGAAITASRAFYASSAGQATTALSAVTAGHALYAGTANNAVTAGRAYYAVTANNAITAGQAVHAASATYAANAGNATHASSAAYASDAGTADTATFAVSANELLATAGNEVIIGSNMASTQSAIWFNYRREIGGATSGNATITQYNFGNGNANTTGVTIKADTFAGQASCAAYANCAAHATHAGSATFAVSATQAQHAASANYSMSAARATYSACANNAVTAGRALFASSADYSLRANKLGPTGNNYADVNGNASLGGAWLLGGTQVAKVWEQMTKPTSATYTTATATTAIITESGDIQLVLSQATASNATYFNLAVDGNMKANEFVGKASCASYAASAAQATHSASANYAATAGYAITAGRAISAASAGFSVSATQAQHAASANYATTASNAVNAGSATEAAHSASATWAAEATCAANATLAGKAKAANITTTNNAVAIYTDTAGGFGTVQTKSGAAYATSTNGALTFGTLPLAQGGTGKTSAVDAANNFMNALTTGSSAPTDADYYIAQYAGGGTTTVTYHRRPHSALWTYIKGKIDAAKYVTSVAGHSGQAVTLSKLTVGHKEYNGSSDIEIKAADLDLAKSMTFLGKTTTPIEDGSTTATVAIIVNGVSQNHTAENGDVVLYDAEEFIYSSTAGAWQSLGLASSYALHNHAHGNISNAGKVSASAAIANGDSLLIGDASDSNGIARSTITFDGSTTTKALTQKGTWETFNNYSLPDATTSTKGGVKIGSNLTISSGTLSLTKENVEAALGYTPGQEGGGGIEYIVGTQTAATNAWTGVTKEATLETGKVIAYKLPFAGTSTAATLDLTLSGGGTSGAKAVILNNNTDVTTHFPVNTIVILTYDGSQWKTFDYNTNTTYSNMSVAERNGATATTARLISAVNLRNATVASADNADHADSATYATNANAAAAATTAGSAIHAASAAYAAYALSAGSSTSSAHATHAGSATFATSAGNATYANSASHAIHAGSAGYATSAANATLAAKATAANITSTANAIAYYTDAAGTFGSKASANGVLYSTAANGALSWGILPVAQGGTGATTAGGARHNLGAAPYIQSVYYGVCSTATATTAKTVTLTNGEGFALATGTVVAVSFTNASVYSSTAITLNVNDTGAKTCYEYGTTAMNGSPASDGWYGGAVVPFIYNGTGWERFYFYNSTYYVESVYCTTAAGTAAKVGSVSQYSLTGGKYFQVLMYYDNTAASALTLNIANTGAKPIYINGAASSTSNYTLPKGLYHVFYDGTNYHFRTDSLMPGNISGSAAHAIHAGSATYSTSAAQAQHAASAAYAASANSAAHATHAGSATYATSAGHATDATKVAKAGDTMTGNLTMSTNTYVQKAGSSVSWYQGRNAAVIKTTSYSGYNSIYSLKTTNGDWSCGVYTGNKLYWTYVTDTNYNANTNTATAHMILDPDGTLHTTKVYGAVWNDYAEFRETREDIEPGRCIVENGDGTLSRTTERLQRGCEIVSDTFGFAIGETEKCKTPTAASGRVLVYLLEDREYAKSHIGWPVCSGPDGTVSIMTEEEEMKYPSRIIGTISEVPDYNIWQAGDKGKESIAVNGRIWIRVR